jgi:hypothetical protein
LSDERDVRVDDVAVLCQKIHDGSCIRSERMETVECPEISFGTDQSLPIVSENLQIQVHDQTSNRIETGEKIASEEFKI